MSNHMDIIDSIISGGMTSARLDAYLQFRALAVQKLGEKAAPIFNTLQCKEFMLRVLNSEITRSYRNNEVIRKFASAFYGVEVTLDMGTTEVARLGQTCIGRDFGIKDLDVFAGLVTGLIGNPVVMNGNMLTWNHSKSFESFDEVVSYINNNGGKYNV